MSSSITTIFVASLSSTHHITSSLGHIQGRGGHITRRMPQTDCVQLYFQVNILSDLPLGLHAALVRAITTSVQIGTTETEHTLLPLLDMHGVMRDSQIGTTNLAMHNTF